MKPQKFYVLAVSSSTALIHCFASICVCICPHHHSQRTRKCICAEKSETINLVLFRKCVLCLYVSRKCIQIHTFCVKFFGNINLTLSPLFFLKLFFLLLFLAYDFLAAFTVSPLKFLEYKFVCALGLGVQVMK